MDSSPIYTELVEEFRSRSAAVPAPSPVDPPTIAFEVPDAAVPAPVGTGEGGVMGGVITE
ncbi:hypothetical protein [Pseudonocardia zijingensis]|jgi:hypothetical protein|uniref:Uncharacterized protein n=1 Tax=Pseudonocardia zijingensis TaxID=153376 RepID=A0ABP3ZTV4_9PSEU